MKKLLPLLLLSLGFIGSANAAKNAGLALAYGFGSVSIAIRQKVIKNNIKK